MSLNVAGTYALCTILPAISTAAVLARLRVRFLRKSALRGDDWTAFAGLIVLWAVASIIIAGTAQGLFGGHTLLDPVTGESSITEKDQTNVEYMWIVFIVSIFSIGLVKLSVVLLYRRIFSISQTFNVYSWCLIALIISWMIAFLAANIFQCKTHFSAAWTSATLFLKYCDNMEGAQAALAVTDLVMDLMILTAPMPILWQLQMAATRKIQVIAIFALGFFAAAASAVRAYILLYDSYGTTLSYRDVQGENTKVVAWSLIEIAAALVGCCLPTLRPLLSNTALGDILSSIFSVISLHSRRSRTSHQGKQEEESAATTDTYVESKHSYDVRKASKTSTL